MKIRLSIFFLTQIYVGNVALYQNKLWTNLKFLFDKVDPLFWPSCMPWTSQVEYYQFILLTDSLCACWYRSPDCLFPWLQLKQDWLCSVMASLCIIGILPALGEVPQWVNECSPWVHHIPWTCSQQYNKLVSVSLCVIRTCYLLLIYLGKKNKNKK